jgi:hypothetical protein
MREEKQLSDVYAYLRKDARYHSPQIHFNNMTFDVHGSVHRFAAACSYRQTAVKV